ncbi:aldo/keto reductase family protein [Paenibacillus profundus]|uniref:Aldo/keto reductase family protein n=1 Tax=Paenibacillus profundus TaxID=1173085 RepID=A0ABS8YH04_9BACL|nr:MULTISPECIES: aldo/keto reductase family protein [Paenibacillus]MCE5171253.1 aldo/keto reductase family protein [Paenibacillus profundus]MCM3337962.1 aldo/keto reductase family protein [Paenibacillus sp. MER TA 81-3]
MKYRRLGTCGLKVSEISLGSWLTYGESIGQSQSEAIIDKAYELGINFFDTANVYHEGAAEEIVGKALAKYERSSYVLATKVYFPMGEGPNDGGLSRKHIIEQCEASLKRLGTDYIDLYQCHRYDSEAPIEETLRALDDLVTQGKVLYVGVSSWEAHHIADAVHTARQFNLDRIVSNQPHYNMLDRAIEKDVLPLCEQEGIGQVVYCPLAQGVLTGKYKPGAPVPEGTRASDASTNMFMDRFMQEHYLRRVERLRLIADRNGISMVQLALAWILRYDIVSSCIIGASRPEQVVENSKASGVKLSEEDLKEIDVILKEEA